MSDGVESLPRASGHRPPTSRSAGGLFALLLGVYLLTTGGHLYAIDEEMMYGLSDALGARGVLYLNDPGPAEPPVYSTYGPGQSVAALPLFWAGELVAGAVSPEARAWVSRAAVGWFNPIVTALLAALVYMAGRRVAPGRAALLAALAYGLGSPAWPYTKTFFAEPLTALLWFASFLLIWRGDGAAPRPRALLLAGLLAGLAPAVKIQAGLALPILGVYVLATSRSGGVSGEGRRPSPDPSARRWLDGLWFAAGAALPLAALAVYNAALFGSPLATGYGGSIWSHFSAPFWEGFGGQIWGLRRGLIWFMPLSLLFPLGLAALWRRDRGAALICLAMPLSQLLFYATWYAWDGAGAWGPRFLNAAMPFVALPLAALFAAPGSQAHAGATQQTEKMSFHGGGFAPSVPALLWVALALLTVPVQLAGLSININQVLTRPGGEGRSQILDHLQLGAERLDRLYQRRFAPDRLVLWAGFAPSEGQGDALLPRWSLPEAELRLRPPADAPATLRIAAQSCWAAPQPTSLSLSLDGKPILGEHTPCPGRVYRLLLPPGAARVGLSSPGWEPAAAGLERPGRLGVYIADLAVTAGGRALPIEGDRLPPEEMPTGGSAMRRWMGDIRLPLWDFWWAYLPLLPLAPAQAIGIGLGWGGFGMGCMLAGAWLLAGGRRRA